MEQHRCFLRTGRSVFQTLLAGILLVAGLALRSMAETTGREISVLDYGAVPDDNTDDTAAVKAALAVCTAKGPKIVSFTKGVFNLAELIFPNDVAVVVENGARLEIASNATVAINGPFTAGPYTVFSGAGRVTFGSCNDILVDWFGARNDGSADATESINRAIDALPTFANLTFGGGNYLVVAGNLTPIKTTKVVQINGQGIDTTRITFNPTSESTLFSFEPIKAGSLVWRCGIRSMSVYGGGGAKKTAIRIVEGRDMIIENIHINYVHATDTESIGLLLYGRDVSTVRNVNIAAPRPILIAFNPNTTNGGLDHWRFTDLSLLAMNAVHSLIEVEDGCNLSNVTFDGMQTWMGGNGGFYWDSSTRNTGNGINISFSNVRWESADIKPTRPTFYLKPHTAATPVNFNNVYCGTRTTGFYLRNIKGATFTGVNVGGSVAGNFHCYDIDGSCDNILFLNFSADQNAGTPLVSGLTKIFSSGFSDYQPPETERIKYYVNDSVKSENSKYFAIMDHRVWTKAVEIDEKTGDGLGYAIPGAVSDGITQVLVAFDEGSETNAVAGGGHFLITRNCADGTSVKLGGTETIVAGRDKNGAVCIYAARGTNTIRVQNKLGSKRKFSVIVYYNSPTFPP